MKSKTAITSHKGRVPTISVRLEPKFRRQLMQIARTERRPLANVVELAVVKFLEERKTA